ncbi:MAG: hypothetical protein JO121_05515 [Deltaproteobacteria bacterium]|nr:hypothetical protein [Deltaproteobacteria bacterium]
MLHRRLRHRPGGACRIRFFLCPAAAVVLSLWLLKAHSADSFNQSTFDLYQGFYGAKAYTDPAASNNFDKGMITGFSFSPLLDAGLIQFVQNRNARLMLELPGSSLTSGWSADYIEQQRLALASIRLAGGKKTLWALMTEWDQSGGSWVPNGRPRYRGLSRLDAYRKFVGYYETAHAPLHSYLSTPLGSRASTLAAITDYSPNAFYAYDLGVDFCFLERGIDELGDLSTGIAFLRGAAAQVDRPWGIDISTWRTSNNLATSFDSAGTLLGGWSPSYLRRHLYVAFLAGAHAIHIEPTVYYHPSGKLNPFGEAVRDFAEFALIRHPDVGRSVPGLALLLDHFNGFDTKHGYYNQVDSVWYQDIAYSEGDYMINNFFKVAYPNHWLQGQTPGAPFLDASGKPNAATFRAYLAAGGDPRPWEPMARTRWGDNLDVITTRASVDSMRRYRATALLGDVTIDPSLRATLTAWVQAGGTLAVNAKQVSAADEPLLGVRMSATTKAASDSRWLPTGTVWAEKPFNYTVVTPTTAVPLASTVSGDLLITVNTVGRGKVILSTPTYLQSSRRDSFLSIGTALFDYLQNAVIPAHVIGSPVEYIVNQEDGRILVMVVNSSGQGWSGTVVLNPDRSVIHVREYTQDQDVPYTRTRSGASIPANVPAYDLRIYAAELLGLPAAPGPRGRSLNYGVEDGSSAKHSWYQNDAGSPERSFAGVAGLPLPR